jgi:hypothetical protein
MGQTVQFRNNCTVVELDFQIALEPNATKKEREKKDLKLIGS